MALGGLRIGHGPGQPFDQLLRGMLVAEMDRADPLVEQYRRSRPDGASGIAGGLGCDDDSGHRALLVIEFRLLEFHGGARA